MKISYHASSNGWHQGRPSLELSCGCATPPRMKMVDSPQPPSHTDRSCFGWCSELVKELDRRPDGYHRLSHPEGVARRAVSTRTGRMWRADSVRRGVPIWMRSMNAVVVWTTTR